MLAFAASVAFFCAASLFKLASKAFSNAAISACIVTTLDFAAPMPFLPALVATS